MFANRNVLFLIIGALIVAVGVLGYNLYQDRKQPEGLQINVGPNGLKIQVNSPASPGIRYFASRAETCRTGAARGTRTPDPVITNDVLYQLSYCGGPWKTQGLPALRT